MRKSLQTLLFAPQKGDFNEVDFEKSICNSTFSLCIITGVLNAYKETRETFKRGDKSRRIQSDFLHESVFNHIIDAINRTMPDENIKYSQNESGNERLFIEYNNYVFILRLKGGGINCTKQSETIRQQGAEKHFIIIEYSLDTMRTKIQSVRFVYEINNQEIYSYDMALSQHDAQIEEQVFEEIKVIKPTLKLIRKKAE